MAQLMAALMAGLIAPLARLQAAFTVWLLKGLIRLLAAVWRASGRGFVAAIGWLADRLYPEPDSHVFDQLPNQAERNGNGEDH